MNALPALTINRTYKYDLTNDNHVHAFIQRCVGMKKKHQFTEKQRYNMVKNEYYVRKYMEHENWDLIEYNIREMGWDVLVDFVIKNNQLVENYNEDEWTEGFHSNMDFDIDMAIFILNQVNEDIKERIYDRFRISEELELQTKLQKQTFEYYNRPENADKKKQMTKMAIDMFNEDHRKKMQEKRHSPAIEFGLDEKKWKKLMNDDFYNVIFETKRYIIKRPIKQQ